MYFSASSSTSVICWSNLSLESNLTPKSSSQSLFLILKLFTFKLTSWLVLTRKWHLSVSPFKRLFSNHLNRDTESRSRGSITSSTFLAERAYYHLQRLQYQYHYVYKTNLLKICWIERSGPKIQHCGTPNITASHLLYELLTLVLCCLCDK